MGFVRYGSDDRRRVLPRPSSVGWRLMGAGQVRRCRRPATRRAVAPGRSRLIPSAGSRLRESVKGPPRFDGGWHRPGLDRIPRWPAFNKRGKRVTRVGGGCFSKAAVMGECQKKKKKKKKRKGIHSRGCRCCSKQALNFPVRPQIRATRESATDSRCAGLGNGRGARPSALAPTSSKGARLFCD